MGLHRCRLHYFCLGCVMLELFENVLLSCMVSNRLLCFKLIPLLWVGVGCNVSCAICLFCSKLLYVVFGCFVRLMVVLGSFVSSS